MSCQEAPRIATIDGSSGAGGCAREAAAASAAGHVVPSRATDPAMSIPRDDGQREETAAAAAVAAATLKVATKGPTSTTTTTESGSPSAVRAQSGQQRVSNGGSVVDEASMDCDINRSRPMNQGAATGDQGNTTSNSRSATRPNGSRAAAARPKANEGDDDDDDDVPTAATNDDDDDDDMETSAADPNSPKSGGLVEEEQQPQRHNDRRPDFCNSSSEAANQSTGATPAPTTANNTDAPNKYADAEQVAKKWQQKSQGTSQHLQPNQQHSIQPPTASPPTSSRSQPPSSASAAETMTAATAAPTTKADATQMLAQGFGEPMPRLAKQQQQQQANGGPTTEGATRTSQQHSRATGLSSATTASTTRASEPVPPPPPPPVAPKRKGSVFSHSGFPSIELLDQDNLKAHSALVGQAPLSLAGAGVGGVCGPPAVNGEQSSSGGGGGVNCPQTTTSNGLAPSADCSNAIGGGGGGGSSNAAGLNKARRPMRSDTLGSTGSSRASSCDEQTIVGDTETGASSATSSGFSSASSILNTVAANAATTTTTAPRRLSSGASLVVAPLGSASSSEFRKSSTGSGSCPMNIVSPSASTSTSSLDSTEWSSSADLMSGLSSKPVTGATMMPSPSPPPPTAAAASTVQANPNHSTQSFNHQQEVSSVEQQAAALRKPPQVPPTTVPPFESIKTQLKRNSMPNAQFIQRHIDNVISRNEAIVDSWNLVSIRSYNSSRDSPPSSSSATAATTKRLATPTWAASLEVKPLQQTTTTTPSVGRPSKRWSTTAIAGGSSIAPHRQQLQQQQQQHQMAASGGTNFRMKQLERKRSYNLSSSSKRRPSTGGALQINPMELQVPAAAAPPSIVPLIFGASDPRSVIAQALGSRPPPYGGAAAGLASASSSPSSVSTSPGPGHAATQHNEDQKLKPLSLEHTFAHIGPPPGAHHRLSTGCQDPTQLESAIQNLSLKRKEDSSSTVTTDIANSSIMNTATSGSGQLLQEQLHLLNNNHPSINPAQLYSSQPPAPAPPSPIAATQSRLDPNLMQLSQQQQQQYQRDEQIVMAALQMERHRQSLVEHHMNLEMNQAAVLRQQQQHQQHQQQQQQMIEHRLEQFRLNQLAATIEQHHRQQQQQQQQHQHQNDAATSQQMAMAAVAAAANSVPAILASLQLQSQQQHAATDMQQPQRDDDFFRDRQAIESRLLKDFLSEVMPPLGGRQLGVTSALGHHQHPMAANPTTIHMEHGGEMLTQSLDSATPSHRCTACDVSFWTRDLLRYHQMTQCTARRRSDTTEEDEDEEEYEEEEEEQDREEPASASLAPLAFNFLAAPNAFDQQPLMFHNHLSKSASPPKRTSANALDGGHSAALGAMGTTNTTTALAAASCTALDGSSRVARGVLWMHQPSDISILKQQLLTIPDHQHLHLSRHQDHQHQQPAAIHAQGGSALPFKKRKISEPNMRY